jgi:pimeloyl-ACP methyl ester carboxylesterase
MRLSGKGTLLAAFLAVVALALLGSALRVYATLHPPRRTEAPPDVEAMQVDLEQVRFDAVDGVRLEGWHVPGSQGMPPIVLCHDLGRSRASLFGLAYDLSRSGFPVLLFDFRGHGSSGGRGSTLGLEEKRDVLGAVDFLAARRDYRGLPLGVYGVGMGAHAAVLAAADRRSIRVLVLDGLYPDPSFRLARRVFAGWGLGIRRLGFLPNALFVLFTGSRPDARQAARVLPDLRSREVLLLAAAGDAVLVREIERIYASIPEQIHVEGNLELLPVSQDRSLFGEDRVRHHAAVREFFATRLDEVGVKKASTGGQIENTRNLPPPPATEREGT